MPEDRFYRWLVGSAAQAIISVDRELIVTSWNQAAAQIFGTSAADILGKPLSAIIPERAWPRMKRVLLQTLNDQVVTAFEEERPGAYGGEMSLSVTLAPILDDAGACIGVSGLVRDITIRKKLQDELTRAEKLAGLGQLAGGVAHHFNNLLCGMTTRIEFALDSRDVRQMERALRVANESSARMAEIVRNLLIFGKPHDVAREPIGLDQAASEFAALRKSRLLSAAIYFDLNLKPTKPVMMNREHFHQALHNLLNNSLEALSGRPGHIRLRTWQDGNSAKLEFADDGPGIDEAAAAHMFEPFYTTKGAFVGGVGNHVGLGLAVAHAVITEMGGRIDAQSAPGGGAQFLITLPTAADGQ